MYQLFQLRFAERITIYNNKNYLIATLDIS